MIGKPGKRGITLRALLMDLTMVMIWEHYGVGMLRLRLLDVFLLIIDAFWD